MNYVCLLTLFKINMPVINNRLKGKSERMRLHEFEEKIQGISESLKKTQRDNNVSDINIVRYKKILKSLNETIQLFYGQDVDTLYLIYALTSKEINDLMFLNDKFNLELNIPQLNKNVTLGAFKTALDELCRTVMDNLNKAKTHKERVDLLTVEEAVSTVITNVGSQKDSKERLLIEYLDEIDLSERLVIRLMIEDLL